MSIVGHISALMERLTVREIEALAPAQRRRLADQFRYWARKAEPPAQAPRSGVLSDLDGQRQEWR